MKRIMLGLLISTMFTAANAEDIAYEKECPNGGSRQVAGSYDSISGDFKLTTEIKDCGRDDEVINGTHIAEGSFSVENSIFSPSATVTAVVSSDLTISNEEGTLSFQCSKTIDGSYDMTSFTLDGSIESDCKQTGQVTIPILDLLSGVDSEEEMELEPEGDHEKEFPEDHEMNDGEFNQCYNPEGHNNSPFNNQASNQETDNQYPNNDYPNHQGPNNQGPNNNPGNGPWNGNNWDEEWDEEKWDENEWQEGNWNEGNWDNGEWEEDEHQKPEDEGNNQEPTLVTNNVIS